MTDETQAEMPVEDAPPSPETEVVTDSSPVAETEQRGDDAAPARDENGQLLSKNAQKRIDELTWKASEREREAAYWRDLATRQQPEPKVEAPAKLPTLEEVGYDESKYQAALLDYSRGIARQEAQSLFTQEREQQREQVRLGSFADRQREFAKTTPDFEERVLRDRSLSISEAMREVIIDSPAGPEVAYYLATNRELAAQIAQLPPHMAALEMGRIEGRLSAQREVAKRPSVSKAPPPPPSVEASESFGKVSTTDADSDRLSDDEWFKAERRRINKRANRNA